MAADSGSSDSIQRLIEVTEQKVRAEERVRSLLAGIEQGQVALGAEIRSFAERIDSLSRCVAGVQQMTVLIVQYMGIVAGQDTGQVRQILQDLVDKAGIGFGDNAHLDISGDIVAGGKEKRADGN